MDNLEEGNQFLENHTLPELNQDGIDNLNIPLTIKEIKLVILKSSEKEISSSRCFTGEFYQNI